MQGIGIARFPTLRWMPMTTYLYLLTAIVFETIGTSALQASEQFTRPKPLLLRLLCGHLLFSIARFARDAGRRGLCHLVRARHRADRIDRPRLVRPEAGSGGAGRTWADRLRRDRDQPILQFRGALTRLLSPLLAVGKSRSPR